MGYAYTANGLLSCDSCGLSGGVRRRKCPHFVEYPQESRRVRYCPAPALCRRCFHAAGGTRGIHADCESSAADATKTNRAIAARLAQGDKMVVAAYGDWHADVPTGFVGVMFARDRADGWHEREYRLIRQADYDPRSKGFLTDYPAARTWGPSDPYVIDA